MSEPGRLRVGDTIDDLCRACKMLRDHAVLAVDGDGKPLRVQCSYCESQHNYRGGVAPAPRPATSPAARIAAVDDGPSIVSERERRFPRMSPVDPAGDSADLEMLLRRVIREEAGISPVPIGERWRGGQLVLRPGRPGLADKEVPLETFFHKIVMVRNRLRTLEQQVNAAELPEDVKLKLQGYITGCYGTLTTFNILFADEDDHFTGAGGRE